MADIVDDFLTRLSTLAPEVAGQVGPTLEAQIRSQWGGTDRGYIRKNAADRTPAARAGQRTAALAAGLQQGQSLGDLFAQAGVPLRTGFRLLSRKG